MKNFSALVFFLVVTTMTISHSWAEITKQPDTVIQHTIQGSDHQKYLRLPFKIPQNTKRISLEFIYEGTADKTVIDFGLLDAEENLIGWSGGNKRWVTVSAVDATPSFSPHLIKEETWKVLLGVPNARPNTSTPLKINIYFSKTLSTSDEPEGVNPPVRKSAGWYRGDLHMHTAHSDGTCESLGLKKMVPCPVFKTLDAAVKNGLDFVAITDHNTVSQANSIRELAPYFDNLLVIPGRELTGFFGHANLLGTWTSLDFTTVSSTNGWGDELNRVQKNEPDSFTAINHPNLPSGEVCMGCGWSPDLNDARKNGLSGLEIRNGIEPFPMFSGLPVWLKALNEGVDLTAVGGSDHHQFKPIGLEIGQPTTVVFADELSTPGILRGLNLGHAYIDMLPFNSRLPHPKITLTALHKNNEFMMGDHLRVKSGDMITMKFSCEGCQGMLLKLRSGHDLDHHGFEGAIESQVFSTSFQTHLKEKTTSSKARRWILAELRDSNGSLMMITNPIYISGELTP